MQGLHTIVEPPVFAPAADNRTFFMVAGDYSEWMILPHLSAMLAREAPGIRIAVVHSVMGRAQKMFEANELDLALNVPRLSAPWLKSRRLHGRRYCVVARKGHPRLGAKLTLDDFCREPHVATVRDDNILEPTTHRPHPGRHRTRAPHCLFHAEFLGAAEHDRADRPDRHGPAAHYADASEDCRPTRCPSSCPPIRSWPPGTSGRSIDPAHSWLRERLHEAAAKVVD